MQDWMRKHRRLIMFFILIFIGIPFVFMFGMPSRRDTQQAQMESTFAQVGGVPLSEAELRRNLESAAAMRRGQDGETPTYQELDEDGTVQRIIENMVDVALLRIKEQERDFRVDESLLSRQMQQWEMFQDENGRFNHQAWNEWVGSVTRWNEIYEDLQDAVARQVYLGTVMAPAGRVLDKQVEQELMLERTKLLVKYAKVEVALSATEEQLVAHFEANPDTYRKPEQHLAEFLAIPMAPDIPDIAFDLVERARDGEDFAELAQIYSDLSMPEGGEMGWRVEDEFMAPHLLPLFELQAGEVSDPVLGPTGYFIYKNEEERINEETGEREVFGRQIVLNAELDDTQREARTAVANEISKRLQDGEDVQVVADEYALELFQTDFFNRTSTSIQYIAPTDIFQFRSQAVSGKDTPWNPIEGRDYIYLTRIAETREGDIPEFEEVRERVEESVIAELKRTEDYNEQIRDYTERIKEEVSAIDLIEGRFPDLEILVGETEEPFTRRDTLFQQDIFVQSTQIHDALRDAEPGEMAGPVSGFFGDYWFFELVDRQAPSEEELPELEQEREQIRERLIQTAEHELLMDYTKDLRERMLASVPFQQDTAVLNRVLGRDRAVPVPDPAVTDATEGEVEIPAEELDAVVELSLDDLVAPADDSNDIGDADDAAPAEEE